MASGIDTVIFDMDGVIFDSEILVLQAWKEVAERHGIAGVEAACHECLGTNSVVSKGIFLTTLAKKPGVEELLKYLKMRGFKIGLASSTREVLVRSEISDGGLLGYFDQIVGGDMVERSKPEPDIFLEACRRLGTRPENCYVIEDSHNGIRAAYAAGMHPIMVPDLMEVTEEMKSLAEEILGSLCAVQEFLQGSGI